MSSPPRRDRALCVSAMPFTGGAAFMFSPKAVWRNRKNGGMLVRETPEAHDAQQHEDGCGRPLEDLSSCAPDADIAAV